MNYTEMEAKVREATNNEPYVGMLGRYGEHVALTDFADGAHRRR
jgi:hypothetical protein